MNKTNLVKSVTAVVLLSFGIAGASMAEPSANSENQRSNQSERYNAEINNANNNLAQRFGLASDNRNREVLHRGQAHQPSIQISIYQRDRYGDQSRGDNILRNMPAGERQAVRYFQNHPYKQRFVTVDNRHRRYVYYRSDYPQWLLNS